MPRDQYNAFVFTGIIFLNALQPVFARERLVARLRKWVKTPEAKLIQRKLLTKNERFVPIIIFAAEGKWSIINIGLLGSGDRAFWFSPFIDALCFSWRFQRVWILPELITPVYIFRLLLIPLCVSPLLNIQRVVTGTPRLKDIIIAFLLYSFLIVLRIFFVWIFLFRHPQTCPTGQCYGPTGPTGQCYPNFQCPDPIQALLGDPTFVGNRWDSLSSERIHRCAFISDVFLTEG